MSEILAVNQPESPLPVQTIPDISPEQLAERRYVDAIQELLDDALEHRHVEPLAEALTWHLARIAFGFGMPAVGDILRRLGRHVGEFAQRDAAQREAEEAKKAGRMTQ